MKKRCCASTYHVTIRVYIQLLAQTFNHIISRSVLDDFECLFQIRKGNLTIWCGLNHVEARANLLIVFLKLSVNLFDHGSNTLGNCNCGAIALLSLLRFL